MRRTLVPVSSNRRAVVVLGAVLLALALVVLASALAPKKADAAQAVTKTFNKPAQILIPAGADLADCSNGDTEGPARPYPSVRPVKAFAAGSNILDVNLVLKGFSHTYPDDVDVLLSKGLRSRTVMSDVGDGDEVTSIFLKLDDEAANFLPDEDELTSGRFKPTNVQDDGEGDAFPEPVGNVNQRSSLKGFDGLSPNGKWKLRVADDAGSDCGSLEQGWSLTIRARVQ
jgi:hypothetical protein